MRQHLSAGLLVFALLAAASAATAQARLPGDADGDARLSLAEFQASRRPLILRADRDGDGMIGPAEWIAGETRLRRDLAAAGLTDRDIDLGTGGYRKMDADKDGLVGAAEVDAYLARRFEALDADHDGLLTPQEFKAGVTAGGRH
jgi:hypothetical protein